MTLKDKPKPKGGTYKKSKAPRPPLQIKLNQAPPPTQTTQVLSVAFQQQPHQVSSISDGPVINNGVESRHTQSSGSLAHNVKTINKFGPINVNSPLPAAQSATQIQSEKKILSNDYKSNLQQSAPIPLGKYSPTPKLKSRKDVARECRNEFPLPSYSASSSIKSNGAPVANKYSIPSPSLSTLVPEFQTLTLKKRSKERMTSNDPRFDPIISPREELLSSIRNNGLNSLKPVRDSSNQETNLQHSRFNKTSPREELLSSIRSSGGLKSLKTNQEPSSHTTNAFTQPPPPPPPAPVLKQPTLIQANTLVTNMNPRDDLLSAIRNSGGVKSLRPVRS